MFAMIRFKCVVREFINHRTSGRMSLSFEMDELRSEIEFLNILPWTKSLRIAAESRPKLISSYSFFWIYFYCVFSRKVFIYFHLSSLNSTILIINSIEFSSKIFNIQLTNNFRLSLHNDVFSTVAQLYVGFEIKH